jgi:2'-5' RNA ligase
VRLFIALDVGAAIQRAAAGVSDELKLRAARLAPRARVSWVKPERMHVTVRFIGEVDDPQSAAIRSALEPALSAGRFDLTIRGVGSFPPDRPPRVLWAGIAEGLEALRVVEREVGARLEGLRILLRSAADYNPHLTLARVKHSAGLRAETLFAGLENVVLGTAAIEAVTLFESRLSSTAPIYVARGRTLLRAS